MSTFRVRAKRGVVVGVGKDLKVGQCADLLPVDAEFLLRIGAVELVDESDQPRLSDALAIALGTAGRRFGS